MLCYSALRAVLGDPMGQPTLYKYLDVQGARLTLGNRTFKHAKPSDFNDVEDLTVRSIFSEDDEAALKQIENGFVGVLLSHLDDPPTCINAELRKKVVLLQSMFKANADAERVMREAVAKGEMQGIFNLDEVRKRNRSFVDEINQQMQNWRVLCVSERNDSERMWTRYAENHQGIILKIAPNLTKDSKYQLFRRIDYCAERPPLYESALSFLEGSLFGDQEQRIRSALERIVYTKTLDWEYEREYRLAIPLRPGEAWDTLPYHPDEISELYLGANMADEPKQEIVDLAQSINPPIGIFQMFHDANGKLSFRPAK
jgi:hypothetical protein